MTILDFVLLEDAAYLVADTQATSADSLQPTCFVTKVFPIPNWQGLICGTGSLPFLLAWLTKTAGILTSGFDELDKIAPQLLRDLYPTEEDLGPDGAPLTSAIFHLGFSSAEERFVGYAYRSDTGFASERLTYGLSVQPGLGRALDEPISTLPDDLIRIACEQKRQDEAKPILQRGGLGGKLIFYVMELGADMSGAGQVVTIASSICHTFADYPEAYARACAEGGGGAPRN